MIDRTLRDRLTDAYMMAIPLIMLNVAWFVASLPLVTAIPAAGALFYATNQIAHGKPASWSTFGEGFRVCFRRSWTWGLLNVLVALAAIGYLYLFASLEGGARIWASALVLVGVFLWLSLQVYTFPLLLEQEQPRLRLAYRNAAILLLRRPLFTFGTAALLIALAIVTTLLLLPAWLLIMGSFCAYLANAATLNSITATGGRRPPTDPNQPA